jgi:lipopolysaccharide export system permease protein
VFGRLDAYVARNVLGAWMASNVFFMLLFIIIDLLVEGLGTIGKVLNRTDLGVFEVLYLVGRYYFFSLPVVFVTVGPFVTVIAAMFAIARLMGGNEIVPMLFTGRSLFRVLAPTMLTAALSATLMGAVWEFAIPRVRDELNHIDQALGKREAFVDENLVLKLREGTSKTLWIDEYDAARLRMSGVLLLVKGDVAGDEVVIDAEAADWNPSKNDWELLNGRARSATSEEPVEMLGVVGLEPERVAQAGIESRDIDALSYSQLLELQALRPDNPSYRLAFHTHLTFPLANFILLLLVLPFAVSFERRSRIERVFFAILACAGYLVTDLTFRNVGSGGYLDPVFSAWLPPIVFGSLGLTFATGIRT